MIELDELQQLRGAEVLQRGQADGFAGVSTDSRTVPPGSLFIALRGTRDGHEFVRSAVEAGAGGVLVEHAVDVPEHVTVVRVPDTLQGLQGLARFARVKLTGRVVAVTGSVGKTTTKNLLQRVLARAGDVAGSERSYNNHLGVPLTLLRIAEENPTARAVVAEVGTNSPGEIEHLTGLIRPHVALVTNVGFAHVGNFESREALAAEKTAIFSRVEPGGTWVVNANDGLLMDAVDRRDRPASTRVVTVGRENAAGGVPDLSAEDIAVDEHGTTGRLVRRHEGREESAQFRFPLVGTHFADTVLFAAAVATELGMSLQQVAEAVADFPAAEGRASIHRVGEDRVLIDDSYNGSPDATLAALDTLATVPGANKVAVLGEMRELGDWSERLHAEVAAKVATVATHFVAVGSNADAVRRTAVEHGLPEEHAWTAPSATAAGELLRERLGPDSAVLVKGSRFSHMERVALMLAGEQVGCPLTACTLYIHCRDCQFLRTGPDETPGVAS